MQQHPAGYDILTNDRTRATPASEAYRRAKRCHMALRVTEESLTDSIAAMPDAADGLAFLLERHRETVAQLTQWAFALIRGLEQEEFDSLEGVDRKIADLEIAVQREIGDATADELSRKISHGEE